jgi:DNA-binding LacI/PurR family transcriptional regulator
MRKKSPNSMRQLAESLGVSQATVSRALGNSREISERTRAQIIAAARKAGVTAPVDSNNITVVLPHSSLEIVGLGSLIITALMNESNRRGKFLEMVCVDHFAMLNEKTTGGVISLDFQFHLSDGFSKSSSLPMVCINDYARRLEHIYSVSSNEQKGMQTVVDHLAGLGHRRIGLIYLGDFDVLNTQIRLATFDERVRCHGGTPLTGQANYTGPTGIYLPSAALALDTLLAQNITALICCGENCWGEVAPSLRRKQIKWPHDLSIVAWMTPDQLQLTAPTMTAVIQPYAALAREAFTLLERRMHGETNLKNIELDYLFIEGESSEPPGCNKQ